MQNKIINAYLSILFVFIILLKFVIMDKLNLVYEIIIALFFITSSIILYKLLGFRKDNNVTKTNAIQITIIGILLYILITYLSGLYFGFLRNSYSLTPISIIKNTYMLAILVLSEEIIRWIIAGNKRTSKIHLVILTILYVILDIIIFYNANTVNSSFKLFIFITTIILPSLARNAVCSYFTYKVSYVPSLILHLFFTLYIYVVPIEPDLGPYLNSIVAIMVPFLIYLQVRNLVSHADKERIKPIHKKMWYLEIPACVSIIFLVILVSGVFKYKIIAIASGSMEPYMYRGDAVIYEKYTGEEKVLKNQILVFIHNGKYVTHRVVDVDKSSDKTKYITKGDNNHNNDDYKVIEEDIVGIVKMKIKFIGYPTIWLQELIK